ncbi:hypothetical protein AB0E77_30245 [Streptomyces sp. NPDC032940]|uniref:hypothetical protein n=1 Tax=Streptomyces sp. NPDC032940 TaxID=3155366 RepID=UPI0033F87F53
MRTFPGTHPIKADTVHLTADTLSVSMTGSITCQGILRHGLGFVELALPDADPQQRRALERAAQYEFELWRGGACLYQSPPLRVHEIRRDSIGALVVTGAPR